MSSRAFIAASVNLADTECATSTTLTDETSDGLRLKICDVVAEALCIGKNKVCLKQNLSSDLEAEYIDLVDIMFRLEKEFHISLPHKELQQILSSTSEQKAGQSNLRTTFTRFNVRHLYDFVKRKLDRCESL